ncbi:MAG: response regulator [Deltaproteobacteria bacterium]|nr:response regulator [Deltaproteobacteria bacterium]
MLCYSLRHIVGYDRGVSELMQNDKKSPEASDDWERWQVTNLLLAGSMYDAHIFLEAGFRAPGVSSPGKRDDGLRSLPGCYMVTTGQQALELVEHESLDLLICDQQLSDMNGFELSRRAKAMRPDLPVVLLSGSEVFGRSQVAIPQRSDVDRIFTWYGNPDLIESILQLVEDHYNAENHILGKNVRCILLIEDESSFFSHYLVMIHRELRARSLALIPEDAQPSERARRIWQMPKLLLAETCEESTDFVDRFGNNMIGVISDLQFPHAGKINQRAGLKLALEVKHRIPRLPVIIQTHQAEMKAEIHQAGAFFVLKDSEGLLLKIRQILLDYFGFGDFIFRLPDGSEVGRARNLKELVREVNRVPLKSFLHHGRANHFSTWFYLHGLYEWLKFSGRLMEKARIYASAC